MRPVRLRDEHPVLEVERSRIVAYVGYCSCGWEGRPRKTYVMARGETLWHECPAAEPSSPT